MDPAVLRASGGLGYVRERAALVDRAVAASAAAVSGVTDDAVAVVAVGGYGRGELFPGSDVDLMILHTAGSDPLAERVAEAVLYPLWDQGLATGNAVRTVDECRDAGGADPRALAALLDARLIAGSGDLVDQLGAAVDGLCGDAGWLVAVLEELRESRRRRHGFLAHANEPDLKESLGGLRDAPLLSWLARAGLAVGEAESLEGPTEILRRARVALHLCTGTRSNRLEAQEHGAVAGALGVADDPEWEARDALLRDVLRAGRTIDVTVGEALGAAAAAAGSPRRAAADRPAELAATLESAPADGRLAVLVDVLAAGQAGARAMEIAAAHGALDAVVPAWGLLCGRVQRDPYHRFPVEVHLLQTAAEASAAVAPAARDGEGDLAGDARTIGDPTALLLGAFLHDAGKVGRGSHVEMGEEVAEQTLADLAAPLELRDDVAFLVREHLLLADTATRRDISEEEVVLRVARAVGDRRRLAMLSVLTTADAAATGPAASSAWRLGLVRSLVERVGRALDHGLVREEDVDQLARAERAIRSALEGVAEPGTVDAFLRSVPSGYLRWADPADAAGDLVLVHPRPPEGEVRVAVRPASDLGAGMHRLAVAARDRPGLLAGIAGACTVAGLSILSAQIFTTTDGVALDVFTARGNFEEEVPPERWERLRAILLAAAAGETDVSAAVEVLRRHARTPAAEVPLTVRLDHEASDFHTVIEVGAADRPGLLFDLASALASLSLDVHLARVATYGHRVVDVFYVTDLEGRTLPPGRDDSVRAGIERALSAP
jgi:[protein-PII] uridylyltransferase